MKVIIRAARPTDQQWLSGVFTDHDRAETSIAGLDAGVIGSLPAFIAQVGDDLLGAISYRAGDEGYTIVMLYSNRPGMGIGRALVNSLLMQASDMKLRTIAVTVRTGDASALRFYQGLGFKLAAVGTTRHGARAHAEAATPLPVDRDEVDLVLRIGA